MYHHIVILSVMLLYSVIGMAQKSIVMSDVSLTDGSHTLLRGNTDISFGYAKNLSTVMSGKNLMYCQYTLATLTSYQDVYEQGTDVVYIRSSRATSNWSLTYSFGKLSGKYRIYIVTVRDSLYQGILQNNRPNKFYATLSYPNGAETTTIQTDIHTTSSSYGYDTLIVADAVDIPVPEKISNLRETFLSFNCSISSRENLKYNRNVYLVKVVAEAIDEKGEQVPEENIYIKYGSGDSFFADSVSDITYHVAELSPLNITRKNVLSYEIQGQISNYDKFSEVNPRYGIKITATSPSYAFPQETLYNGERISHKDTAGTKLFSMVLPPLTNTGTTSYNASAYMATDNDSIFLNYVNIPSLGSKALDVNDFAHVTKVEQIAGTYNIKATIDATKLYEYLKQFYNDPQISGLDTTLQKGIYEYTCDIPLLKNWESGRHTFGNISFGIPSGLSGELEELNCMISSEEEFEYTRPDKRTGTLGEAIKKMPQLSIFNKALELTGLDYTISEFIDYSYTIGEDSVEGNISKVYFGGRENIVTYPQVHHYKFTAFAEPDSIYAKNGINNIEDLETYAKNVYDKTYPSDAGKYDNDFTNPKNPLNRFMRYHLIDRYGDYDDWAPSGSFYTHCILTDLVDAEDYWEMMSGEMMRCSRSVAGLYINRKGLKQRFTVRGTKVFSPSDNGTICMAYNGTCLLLDNILAYTPEVRDNVLHRRLRIDSSTLSADFMNSGSRFNDELGSLNDHLYSFKKGYLKGWETANSTFVAIHPAELYWSSYLGNTICIKGQYDVTVKLPTPPAGKYEVRLGYVAGEERGQVQVYANEKLLADTIDLTYGTWNLVSIVGDLDDTGDEAHDKAIDDTIRTLGFMKAMDSYKKPSESYRSFRVDSPEHLRRILGTVDVKEGEELKIRFKQLSLGDREMSFDYLELCPVDIIPNEDRH